jgi:hypothetical protein
VVRPTVGSFPVECDEVFGTHTGDPANLVAIHQQAAHSPLVATEENAFAIYMSSGMPANNDCQSDLQNCLL